MEPREDCLLQVCSPSRQSLGRCGQQVLAAPHSLWAQGRPTRMAGGCSHTFLALFFSPRAGSVHTVLSCQNTRAAPRIKAHSNSASAAPPPVHTWRERPVATSARLCSHLRWPQRVSPQRQRSQQGQQGAAKGRRGRGREGPCDAAWKTDCTGAWQVEKTATADGHLDKRTTRRK